MNKTLEYYNNSIIDFANSTINANVSDLYELFLKKLHDGAYILDLGCGTGRDSKAFIEKGYKVLAMDGSIECCNYARNLLNQEVLCKRFNEIDYTNEFDGIWACASLLHIPSVQLVSIFNLLSKSLKANGIIYCSFKYGDFEGERNGRHFTDLTEQSFSKLVQVLSELKIISLQITGDVRTDRADEKWLNCLLQKV